MRDGGKRHWGGDRQSGKQLPNLKGSSCGVEVQGDLRHFADVGHCSAEGLGPGKRRQLGPAQLSFAPKMYVELGDQKARVLILPSGRVFCSHGIVKKSQKQGHWPPGLGVHGSGRSKGKYNGFRLLKCNR